MFAKDSFRLLTDLDSTQTWNGELPRIFGACRELNKNLNADIRAGRLPTRSCIQGRISNENLQSLRDAYPLELKSPFEQVASISGGLWQASELIDENDDDAALKLRFEAGTTDLPMHSHDYSNRVVVVIEGNGVFEVAADSPGLPSDPCQIHSIQVEPGDVLAFSRGVLHTFKAESEDLLLFSYHAPFIPLDDPRQFTIPDALANKPSRGQNFRAN